MNNLGYCLYGFYQNLEMPLPLMTGIDNVNKLEVISLDNLSAVVSQVPLEEFGEDALKENIQDVKWLEKYIRAYDNITQKLFSQTTFIPVRFGTIYLNKERVKQSISNYKEQVIKLIETLNGKIEVGVKFFLDRNKLQETLTTNDLEAKELNSKIKSETPGKAHFLKKKFEALLDTKVENWSSDVSNNILNSLKGISNGIQLLSLQPKEGVQKMFLNVACLLPSNKFDWFKEMLQNIMSQEYFESINCEITGPWPPYNFVRLESEKQEKESTSV